MKLGLGINPLKNDIKYFFLVYGIRTLGKDYLLYV